MRRIIMWLSATVVAVALLIDYQVVYAGVGGRGEGDRGQACPSPTAASTTPDPLARQCEPGNGDRERKPGDNGRNG